jgi:hypothetical protein
MRNAFLTSLVLGTLLVACTPQTALQATNPPATNPSGPASNQPSVTPGTQVNPPGASPPGTPASGQSASAQPVTPASPGKVSAVTLAMATSLRLSAPTRFLSYLGETLALRADVLDAQGQVLANVPLDWISSRPGDFSVDAQGLVKALETNGYSEITASLPGSSLKASLIINISGGKSSGGGGGGSSASTPQPPAIQALTASRTSVTGPGVPIQLNATADAGSTYSWRCTGSNCSDFSATTGASVFWRTPSVPGVYTLELTVTREGATTVQLIPITVGGGTASVTVNTGIS